MLTVPQRRSNHRCVNVNVKEEKKIALHANKKNNFPLHLLLFFDVKNNFKLIVISAVLIAVITLN